MIQIKTKPNKKKKIKQTHKKAPTNQPTKQKPPNQIKNQQTKPLKCTIESLDLVQMDLNWSIAAHETEPKYLVLSQCKWKSISTSVPTKPHGSLENLGEAHDIQIPSCKRHHQHSGEFLFYQCLT